MFPYSNRATNMGMGLLNTADNHPYGTGLIPDPFRPVFMSPAEQQYAGPSSK